MPVRSASLGMELRTMMAVEDEARASTRDLAGAALRNRLGTLPATIEIEDEQGNEVRQGMPPSLVH